MNNIYVSCLPIPFPQSEYGGLLVISAESEDEALEIMFNYCWCDLHHRNLDDLEAFKEEYRSEWNCLKHIGTTEIESGIIESFDT